MTEAISRSYLYEVYPHARTQRDVLDGVVRDLAFDYLLGEIDRRGMFEELYLTFKGGTELRKCEFGYQARLSEDLDLDIGGDPDEPPERKRARVGAAITQLVDDYVVPGFAMRVERRRRGYTLVVGSDLLPGKRQVEAKLDLSPRGLVLPTKRRAPLHNPMHDHPGLDADFAMIVIDPRETFAEKLCRWAIIPTVRDLYDLALLSSTITDHDLIAELYAVTSCYIWAIRRDAQRPKRPAGLLTPTLAGLTLAAFNLRELTLPTGASDEDKAEIVAEHLRGLREPFALLDTHIATPELQRFATGPDGNMLDNKTLKRKAQARRDELTAEAAAAHHRSDTKFQDPGIDL